MTLPAGTKLGLYEIRAKMGEDGMGDMGPVRNEITVPHEFIDAGDSVLGIRAPGGKACFAARSLLNSLLKPLFTRRAE